MNELKVHFNILNAELNRIYHSLALLGAHPILHISRIRINIIALSTLNLPTRFFVCYFPTKSVQFSSSPYVLHDKSAQLIARTIPVFRCVHRQSATETWG
jgi:hypothetical protein